MTLTVQQQAAAREAWEAKFSTGATIIDGIYAVYEAGLNAQKIAIAPAPPVGTAGENCGEKSE